MKRMIPKAVESGAAVRAGGEGVAGGDSGKARQAATTRSFTPCSQLCERKGPRSTPLGMCIRLSFPGCFNIRISGSHSE
ncbi:hypothetical protein J6590_006475 [Homalodisca vitripennis]|nr:hypothetical protein J6590_006475 [Homalodisca vitripennis]